jgi:putative hemolysin
VASILALLTVIGLCVALFVLVGELVPKALVVAHPERWALRLAGPTQAVIFVASPLMRPMLALGEYVSSRVTLRPADPTTLPEDDVQWLVREGTRRGIFNATEQELIAQVFKFAGLPVKRAMTPRTDISAIDETWPRERILKFIATEGYSRYPVHAGNLDRIVGVIHTKDVITVLTSGGVIIVEDLIRPPMFVPHLQTLGPLLRRMQKRQAHMAIVLDEFGGTAGLVTLEDLLEEIVGEIRDEHDREEAELTLDAEGRARIAGSLPIDEFNHEFAAALDESAADTMAGLFVLRLGRMPQEGDTLEDGGIRFTAECVRENRLEWLRGERVVAVPPRGDPAG